MKIKRGIIQMLVAAVITLFAAGCSNMVEELKVQEELKFLTPGSYTISGTDYTIMKMLVTKNGESAGTVDSNGLVTINVDSSTTYEITVVKDGTLTLVKNDSSSVVTYVGKFTFKTKTETTLKNTADASDTIVFVMNAEIGALPDGTYEIDGTNYTISDKTVAKESDGSSAGSVGSDGIVTVNKLENEWLTITVFGDYSVEALKTTTADGETTKKFYKGAFESSIATLKKDGTDDSDTLVIKKIASAGNSGSEGTGGNEGQGAFRGVRASVPGGITVAYAYSISLLDPETNKWQVYTTAWGQAKNGKIQVRIYDDDEYLTSRPGYSHGFKFKMAVYEDYAAGSALQKLLAMEAWDKALYYYAGDETFDWDELDNLTVPLTAGRTEPLPKLTVNITASDGTPVDNMLACWGVTVSDDSASRFLLNDFNGIYVSSENTIELSSLILFCTKAHLDPDNGYREVYVESPLDDTAQPQLLLSLLNKSTTGDLLMGYRIGETFQDYGLADGVEKELKTGNWYDGSDYYCEPVALTWDGTSDATLDVTVIPTPESSGSDTPGTEELISSEPTLTLELCDKNGYELSIDSTYYYSLTIKDKDARDPSGDATVLYQSSGEADRNNLKFTGDTIASICRRGNGTYIYITFAMYETQAAAEAETGDFSNAKYYITNCESMIHDSGSQFPSLRLNQPGEEP